MTMHNVEANGVSIPALGLGTWTLKGAECEEIVAGALSLGYRHIDTAAIYRNEEAIGAALRATSVARDDIFVTTKIWWTDLAAADLRRSTETSLAHLGLDAVDLLLIHWPNPAIALEESIAALNRLRQEGLARNIGVSNFPTALLKQAIALSDSPLAVNQVEHHPYLDQSAVRAVCEGAGMALTGYCPLYRGGDLLEEPAVVQAAKTHGKTPGQVVLRWHVQQQNTIAIPRTTRKERLAENIAIFDFALSQDEMAAISALGTAGHRLCDYDFSPQWDAV